LNASLYKPNFSSVLLYAIEKPVQFQTESNDKNQSQSSNFSIPPTIHQISKLVRLTQLQELVLSILLKQSQREEIRKQADEHVQLKLTEFVDSFNETGRFYVFYSNILILYLITIQNYLIDNQLNQIPIETLHTILFELENLYSNQTENLEQIYNKLFKGK
jgi:hypothetical protein